VSAIATDDATHAHGRCALEQALSDKPVRLRDTREAAGYREHTIVNTLYDLTDAGAYASLVA
jgi:hypothetical protein